jgi:Derlin-2/3
MPVVTRAYTTACVITTLAVVCVEFCHQILNNCIFTRLPTMSVGILMSNMSFQQLDLVSPFQLYFNPILIVEQYQVKSL